MRRNKTQEVWRCFQRKRPGLFKVKPSKTIAKNHIGKAKHNLRAMKIMADKGIADWTIVCGYYAMYHAVLAALKKIGVLGKDHECSLKAFELFYVRKGQVKKEFLDYIKYAVQLDEKYILDLSHAKSERIKIQYEIAEVEPADIKWIMQHAVDFVLEVERAIG